MSKKAEAIAKEAFFEPADMASGRAKQQKRWGALRSLVGDEAAGKESPFLKYDAGDAAPSPPSERSEVAGGKGKFQARGGRVRKAMGGRVKKTHFSCY